ncbi:MAG: HAMP domain-containing protein [Acidobacteriaceae bacterium]|nr:HAMP domain-containing protein [Acidobacteriaceae bacterium]
MAGSRALGYHGSVVRRRLASAAAALSFVILLALLIWQGSFRISYSPANLLETIILWAVSTLIFLLTVLLAFLLFRAGVKVYIDRQRNREGSRIRSKLLFGALVLTLAPALFSVLFSGWVLNRHLDVWFSRSAQNALRELDKSYKALDLSYRKEAQAHLQAEADFISLLPETRDAVKTGHMQIAFFNAVCAQRGIQQLILTRQTGVPMLLYQRFGQSKRTLLKADAVVTDAGALVGRISIAAPLTGDPASTDSRAAQEATIQQIVEEQEGRRKFYRETYFQLICLITLFVLFFASWSAQILARQISVPISALLEAASEVRRGNLSYRVRESAMDELATLVRAFNEMTNDLESNSRELEARRRFTEAILESIPTGVISVSGGERIERINRALSGIFSQEVVAKAKRLEDLFSGEDLAEIRYLLKKARRTGGAATQLDIQRPRSILHLAVTVASLAEQRGFVIVLEDTSDLLRAQKAAAWQEVARRIAHEIKNPLTPISLSADRIARHLSRISIDPGARAILEECTQTIQQEVQTVKTLVNEFSRFSRFPTAQLAASDLNDIVRGAVFLFEGRLDEINVALDLDPKLPMVMADKEQIKRVIVNLIENAAEAMRDAPVRQLTVATRQLSTDVVQLSVTDTGCGISSADKDRLFLPYFSTKARGTGLGLAIVSHIVAEHRGVVHVEDNYPTGAQFVIHLNVFPADGFSIDAEAPAATLKV